MRHRTTRSPRPVLCRLGVLVAVGATLLGAPAARAETTPPEDPNLRQSLAPGQSVVDGERVLENGHVDLGPRFDDGQWRLLIHDDVAKADANATSVWRHPEQTVLRVLDEARLSVPDDPAYDFLGAEPDTDVWVVPQTQNPDVVWVGWNTQDPEVMKAIDRGVTLSLAGVQGPGTVTVYLQSGSFGEPQVLWDSRVHQPQPIWVDVNTHTHANWVFTEPGVYLVALTAEADLVDGGSATDTRLVRFAVGSATSTGDALAAGWQGPSAAPVSSPAAVDPGGPAASPPDQDPLVFVLVVAIIVVALGLAAGFAVVLVRGRAARRRVLSARPEAAGAPQEEA